MKVLVLLSLVGVTLALPAAAPTAYNYHETVGIPAAARLKAAEEAQDFDGSRIVGGTAAPLGQYPHMGGLVITMADGRVSVCGSSLLSNTRAVTAAHCWFDGFNFARQFEVVLGSTTVFTGGTRVVTSDVEIHADYSIATINNDIAIIRLPWVSYTNVIRNIALPTGALAGNDFAGFWAQAAGFGLQADGIGLSPNQQLHHVTLEVISNAACAQTYGPFIVESTLCTSGAGGRNICSSDSGGPLSIGSGDQSVLIGVTSFGAVQCETGFPSAYARVTSFLPWIQARL